MKANMETSIFILQLYLSGRITEKEADLLAEGLAGLEIKHRWADVLIQVETILKRKIYPITRQ